jgi:hypothetical protein
MARAKANARAPCEMLVVGVHRPTAGIASATADHVGYMSRSRVRNTGGADAEAFGDSGVAVPEYVT